MKNLKISLIVFMAGVLTLTLEAKKVTLKYNLEKGAEFTFEMVSTQSISQEVMGQVQETTSEMLQVMKFTVKDINADGNYIMEKVVARYKAVTASPMGDMEFDSETSTLDNAFGKAVTWMTTTPIEFVMTTNGEILEVKDLENLGEKFGELMSDQGPEFQMVASLAPQFTSLEGIKQTVGSLMMGYPAGKVSTGKAWEHESTLKQMVDFSTKASTKVNQVKGNTAFLTQEATIAVGEGSGSMEMQGMQMEFELTGVKNGSYEVDLKTGLIQTSEGITTISGIISVDSPQLPAPMSIPMTIKNTEKVTLQR